MMEAEESLEDWVSGDIHSLLAEKIHCIVKIITIPKSYYFLNIAVPEFVFDVFGEIPGRRSRPTAHKDRFPETIPSSILLKLASDQVN